MAVALFLKETQSSFTSHIDAPVDVSIAGANLDPTLQKEREVEHVEVFQARRM